MKVQLIGWTHFDRDAFHGATGFLADGESGSDLAEAAGRLCYLAWGRKRPETATNFGYLRNIIKQRHFSVLEHGTATFLIQGVSRSLTHELVRHRHFSFSEVSQRYVDAEEVSNVLAPAIRNEYGRSLDMDGIVYNLFTSARQGYAMIVEKLESWGHGRKQAREAARSVLPNMTETKIVVTGNYRAWRHFINIRGSEHADAEIRALAVEVASWLVNHAPNAFQDVEFFEVDGVTCVRMRDADRD